MWFQHRHTSNKNFQAIAVTTFRKSKTQAESSDGIIYWAAGIPIGPNNTAIGPAFVDAQFNTKKCLKKIVDQQKNAKKKIRSASLTWSHSAKKQ